jgi:hypothetical protein
MWCVVCVSDCGTVFVLVLWCVVGAALIRQLFGGLLYNVSVCRPSEGSMHGASKHGTVLMRTGVPEPLDKAALRAGHVKLLKADICQLLKFRQIAFKSSMLKAALLRLLIESAFEGEGQEVIESIIAKHSAAARSQDQVLVEKLQKNPQLADVLDLLPTMDQDTAQAFPEFSKAQKIRSNPKWKAFMEFEKDGEVAPEPNHDDMSKGRKRPYDDLAEEAPLLGLAPLADGEPPQPPSSSSSSSSSVSLSPRGDSTSRALDANGRESADEAEQTRNNKASSFTVVFSVCEDVSVCLCVCLCVCFAVSFPIVICVHVCLFRKALLPCVFNIQRMVLYRISPCIRGGTWSLTVPPPKWVPKQRAHQAFAAQYTCVVRHWGNVCYVSFAVGLHVLFGLSRPHV